MARKTSEREIQEISLNAEGIQGPWNQRSDLTEAKRECKRLCDEHTAIAGNGNKPIPPEQHVMQRLDQQFEGLRSIRLPT